MKKENPYVGGIIALALISFGCYRLYKHFIAGQDLATYKLIFAGAFIVYGFVLIYRVFSNNEG